MWAATVLPAGDWVPAPLPQQVYYGMESDRGPLGPAAHPEEITMMSFRKRYLSLAMVAGLAVFGVACEDDVADDPAIEEPADDFEDDGFEDDGLEDDGLDDDGLDDDLDEDL